MYIYSYTIHYIDIFVNMKYLYDYIFFELVILLLIIVYIYLYSYFIIDKIQIMLYYKYNTLKGRRFIYGRYKSKNKNGYSIRTNHTKGYS